MIVGKQVIGDIDIECYVKLEWVQTEEIIYEQADVQLFQLFQWRSFGQLYPALPSVSSAISTQLHAVNTIIAT